MKFYHKRIRGQLKEGILVKAPGRKIDLCLTQFKAAGFLGLHKIGGLFYLCGLQDRELLALHRDPQYRVVAGQVGNAQFHLIAFTGDYPYLTLIVKRIVKAQPIAGGPKELLYPVLIARIMRVIDQGIDVSGFPKGKYIEIHIGVGLPIDLLHHAVYPVFICRQILPVIGFNPEADQSGGFDGFRQIGAVRLPAEPDFSPIPALVYLGAVRKGIGIKTRDVRVGGVPYG